MTSIVGDMLASLASVPKGRIFIKPNIVTANKRYIHHSYTQPAVVESMVRVLRESGSEDISIGESGGFGIPSRLFFAESGYEAMARRLDVPLLDLNEEPLTPVAMPRAAHHETMLLAECIRLADYKIWMPKLKQHIFTSFTNTLKLNVGILTHKERMLYHDWRIHEKIVDLLEVGYPDLVIVDAVDITYGFESAPHPVRLGALIGADDPLAADVVCAHIMGHDPHQVRHLVIAAERGYGSLDLADIDIEGDVSLEELRQAPKGERRLFQDLPSLDTPIRFYAGTAKDTGQTCDGGCEGALKGCLGTIEKRRPGSLAKAQKGAIVTGVFPGDVIEPDRPVLLLGDCTVVEGRLEAQRVVRIRGCPMPARDLFLRFAWIFRLPSPMLDLRDILLFIRYSMGHRARLAWGRLRRVFR